MKMLAFLFSVIYHLSVHYKSTGALYPLTRRLFHSSPLDYYLYSTFEVNCFNTCPEDKVVTDWQINGRTDDRQAEI